MSHKRELKRGYKKKGYFIITKRSTYQEDMTLVNINAPNVGASEYRPQILLSIKGELGLLNLDFLFLVNVRITQILWIVNPYKVCNLHYFPPFDRLFTYVIVPFIAQTTNFDEDRFLLHHLCFLNWYYI